MKHLLIGTLAWTLTVPPVPAQKIESETPSREHVVRVQTAMNHLTVIEVGEPVTTVAVGSPQSFKVERRDNKVFVQPLVESVSTNLFIWTASTRLNYELVPAISDPEQMDFAIDYRQPQPQAQLTQPAQTQPVAPVSAVPGEMLLNSTPVRLVGTEPKANVGVLIRDVYRKQDEVFIRYSIENRSSQTFRTGEPTAVSLRGLKFDRSLWGFQNSQLGVDIAATFEARWHGDPGQDHAMRTGDCGSRARRGSHWRDRTGTSPWPTGMRRRPSPRSCKFMFPVDRSGNLTATLVL